MTLIHLRNHKIASYRSMLPVDQAEDSPCIPYAYRAIERSGPARVLTPGERVVVSNERLSANGKRGTVVRHRGLGRFVVAVDELGERSYNSYDLLLV